MHGASAASAPDGPPLCDQTTRTTQTKGKSYQQSRYQLVAKALGSQAVVASICAQNVTGSTSAPTFGYNGAMQAIVNRLKNALSGQCLPQQLTAASDGTIPCLILIEYPSQMQTGSAGNFTDPPGSCTDAGMSILGKGSMADPDGSLLARFNQGYLAALGDAGVGQTPPVVCQFQQLLQSLRLGRSRKQHVYGRLPARANPTRACATPSGAANTGGCAQAIKFGGAGPPAGTTVNLECIEQSGGGTGGDAGGD